MSLRNEGVNLFEQLDGISESSSERHIAAYRVVNRFMLPYKGDSFATLDDAIQTVKNGSEDDVEEELVDFDFTGEEKEILRSIFDYYTKNKNILTENQIHYLLHNDPEANVRVILNENIWSPAAGTNMEGNVERSAGQLNAAQPPLRPVPQAPGTQRPAGAMGGRRRKQRKTKRKTRKTRKTRSRKH